jgi:ADP-heptose:LPS heptosyltransferase
MADDSIVIYRLGSLGDTVVALPCFNRIADSFPDSRRIVLTNVPVAAVAAPLESILGDGLIQGVVRYPVEARALGTLLQLRRNLQGIGAETLIYLSATRGRTRLLRDLAWFRLCGFRHIVGAPWGRDLQYPRLSADGTEEPEAERLARCLAELGPIDTHDPGSWSLRLTADELHTGLHAVSPLRGKPFIAVNTGGKAVEKDWGANNWLALLERLGRAHLGLVLLGAPEDSSRAQRLAGAWIGPSLDLCGRLSPRESAAALGEAALFIGHDSGPLHLAAAMNVPCIGIFGGSNRPRRWHPYGIGHRVIHEMRGVEFISPIAVEEAARALLMDPVRPLTKGA